MAAVGSQQATQSELLLPSYSRLSTLKCTLPQRKLILCDIQANHALIESDDVAAVGSQQATPSEVILLFYSTFSTVESTEAVSQNVSPRSFMRWATSSFGLTVNFKF